MVVERGGEKSDPTHGLKRLTEYSCWANEAWINFIEKVGPVDPINTDFIQFCLVNRL
jgi:hypothetical protein